MFEKQRKEAEIVMTFVARPVVTNTAQVALTLMDAIERSGLDVSPCGMCGETVVCIPDGMPICETCEGDGVSHYEIVNSLRGSPSPEDIEDAADMLDLLLSRMQSHSLDMSGKHTYRFRTSGWPWTHAVGPTREAAVKAAVAEVKRAKEVE